MSKIVYAVTRGSYSDYCVLCVCKTEKKAHEFADAYNADADSYDDASVEYLRMFEGEPPRKVWTYRSETILHDDGRIGDTRWWSYVNWNFDGYGNLPPRRPKVDYCRAPILNGTAGYLRVEGATEKGVAKVTGERIAAFKAHSWMPHRNAVDG